VPIGKPDQGFDIREVPGGLVAAEDLFDCLGIGGTVQRSDPNLVIVELPADAGFITFRPISRSQKKSSHRCQPSRCRV
jgi:hypothetical protein